MYTYHITFEDGLCMIFTLVETPGRIEEENILPSERAKHRIQCVREWRTYVVLGATPCSTHEFSSRSAMWPELDKSVTSHPGQPEKSKVRVICKDSRLRKL